MKNIGKHRFFLASFFFSFLCLIFSCNNITEVSDTSDDSPKTKECIVRFSVSDVNSRAIKPEVYKLENLAFSLEGKLDDDNTVSGKWNSYTDMNKTAFTMRAGTWSFTMYAYAKTETGEPSNEPMLYSTITKKIVEGSNSLDFTMKVCETGYGSFSMDLTFNKTVTKVEATLCKMDKTPVTAKDLGQNYDPSSCGEITQTWTGEDLSEGKVTYEIKNILKGNYTLSFTLTEGAKTVSYDELAKVVPGTSSSGNYDISDTNKEITRYYAVYYEDGVEDEEIKVPEDNTLYKYGQKILLKFPPEDEGAETENELLKRDGWEFIGWQYKKTLFERNGLGEIVISEDINEEEIHLVAAWVREGNKTVIYFHGNGGKAKMNDGSIVELYEQTGEKEKPIDLWPCNFERTGFEFLGWAEDEEAAEVTIKDQAQLSFTVDTTYLYAVWQPGYVVKYMQQNTDCNGYTEVLSETKYGKAGETVAVTKNASLYEGFTLVDFELPTIAADGSTEVVLNYNRNFYTLSYDDGVPNETISVPDSKDYPYGASVELTTVTVPTRTGYNFGGWLLDTDLLGEEFTMPAENTVLTAKWNVKDGIEYTVRHYLQKVEAKDSFDETDYVEDEKALYTGSGKTGEDTNANPKNYAGFKNREFSQEPIKADGSTEIKIYYDRNMHSVSYDLNGVGVDEGEDSLEVPEKKDYRFGTMDIPVNFPDSYKNFAGYEFLGWAKKPWEVIATRKESEADFIESGTKSFTMEDSDVTLYAVWKLKTDVTYTVKHLGQSLESDDKYIEIHDSTILHGTTGNDTAGTSLTIIGFTEKEVETKPISRKGDTVIEYLYTRNKYTVKYDQNMPKEWTEDPERHADDVSVPVSASYRFESVVPYATATINDEDGYDFSGWAQSANAEAADYSENFKLDADLVARANKDNEITLYAVWNPKDITYKVEHYKQNIDDDNYTLIEPVSTENASAWTSVDAADKKINIEGFEYASKVDVKLNPHADNNVAKIYYNRLTASLTYDANGGSEITNSKTTYRYGKVVDLNFAGVSRKGYDFLGWASAKEATKPEYTSDGTNTITMGTENKTLYAVWTESTYTLKYDLNLPEALAADGRANITAPDDDSKKYLTTVTYTPATINDEDGYDFSGWATSANAEAANYSENFKLDADLVAFANKDNEITLYAVWKAQEIEYTVKYWQQNLDAGTDFNKDEYTEVSSASETLKAEVWTTTAVSADEGKFTGFEPLKTGNVTINPHQLNVVNVYYDRVKGKVYYDANDGGEFYYDDNNEKIYNNPPQDSNSYRYEETVTVKFSMSRLGYNFRGWASASDAPEPQYTSDGTNTITMGTKDITLYAVWEARSDTSYTVEHYKQKLEANVNFDKDDYELVSYDTAEGKTADNTVAIANSYPGFIKGFTVGNEPGDITQEKIAGNGKTVIRIYYNRKKYSITYDSNLNSIGKTSTVDIVLPSDSNKYRYEADVTVSFDGNISDVSVVRGYSFVGWNTSSAVDKALYSSDGTTSFTINETIDNLVSDTNNLTLYAIWQANNVSGKTEDGGESTENNGINITTPEYPASDSDTELISSTDATTGYGEYVTFTINTEAIAAIVDKEKMSNLVYTWYLGRTEITSEVTSEDNNLTFNWDSSNYEADNYSIMLKLTGTDESSTTKVYSQTVYFNLEK